jgi:hypothetical protein
MAKTLEPAIADAWMVVETVPAILASNKSTGCGTSYLPEITLAGPVSHPQWLRPHPSQDYRKVDGE